jgi:hypothetical protein
MTYLYLLMAAYGVTFGFQNKVPFLYGKLNLLDSLLKCTYCLGFHSGWIVWLIWGYTKFFQIEKIDLLVSAGEMFVFSFASAGFSYLIDTGIRLMENYSEPYEE